MDMATTDTGAAETKGKAATLEADVSHAVRALETAISTLRDQLDSAKRLAERLEQVCDEGRNLAKLTEQALLKLEADRSGAEALHIQLESEVERLREALSQAKTETRRPWWHRLRSGRLAASGQRPV